MDITPTQAPNCHDPLSCKTIAYSADALKAIRERCRHDQHAKILASGAIATIRELRINHNSIKHNTSRVDFHQKGHNAKNLRCLLNCKTNSTYNIIGATCNVQSLKSKELLISDLIKDYSLDFLTVTETWLSGKTDKQWYQNTEFNHNGLKLYNVTRKNRKGEGLAFMVSSNTVSDTIPRATRSFEYATWK